MRVVITGAAGFIGRKLADRLLDRGYLAGPDGPQTPITELVLFDIAPSGIAGRNGIAVDDRAGDIADRETVDALLDGRAASVFHLAAVVSSAAEADFDLGMRVNLDGTRVLLDACRALPTPARLVGTSSVAVFGGALPPVILDDTALTPQSSYGAQKAAGEFLVTDYSRKGFVDGRVLRLPTIVVRPGRPNKAASSFASSLFREPLQGEQAVIPVPAETPMWLSSPRRAVDALVHGHDLDGAAFGDSRSVSLPGLSLTVAEMAEALGRAGGPEALDRLVWQRDPAIEAIVGSWPAKFDTAKANALGFPVDPEIDAILAAFKEDDMVRASAHRS